MPVYDRLWRLGVAALALIGCLAAGLFAWYLVTGGSLEQLLSSAFTFSTAGLTVWGILALCAVTSQLAAARKRERARHAALGGDLGALPPSRIVPRDEHPAVAELRTSQGVVSADDVGLHSWRYGKRDRAVSVPWGEARLLEVWQTNSGRQGRRGFTLYGQRARIEWWLPRDRQMRLQKQADAEAVLLAAIHTHTGLLPRTLASALRVPDASPAERAGPKPLGTILVVVFALLPFAIAAAALLLPLTTEPALNAYMALTFAMLGLLGAIATVQALGDLFRRAPLPDPAMILPPGAPPSDASGSGTYALRWRERPLTRVAEAAVGALFAGNLVPLIGIAVGFGVGSSAPLAGGINIVAGILALLGMLMLFDAAFSKRQTVAADATGLSAGRQKLRWEAVEEVVAHVSVRSAERFKVVGDMGDVTIEWPAKVRATPRPGAQAISPGELAALVVTRSGKALRVEE